MRNFFKGLSVTQLSAGALAAVTSFLLSAKIGIAGSVIGVAVGSIVSAVASQIYQNVLKASSEKLQNAVPFHATDGADGVDGADGLEGETAVSVDDASTRLDAVAESTAESMVSTQTMPATGRVVRGSASASRRDGVSSGVTEVGRNRSGVNRQRGSATSAKAKRVAILVAIGSALVAVAVTAGIILAVTQGQGTDSVVRDWVDRSYTERPTGPVEGGDRDREPEDGAAGTGNTDGASGSNDSGTSGTTTPQPDGESSTDGTTDGGTGNGSVDGSTGVDGSSSQGGGTLQGSTDTGTQGTTGSDTSSGSSGSSTSGTDTAGK